MRKDPRLLRRLPATINKVKRFCESGPSKSLNFEIDGKRYYGETFSSLTFSDEGIAFGIDKEEFFIKIEDIYAVKRLRTRKFLFFVEKQKTQEVPKPKKKAVTKKEKTSKARSKKDQAELVIDETENLNKGE